MKEERICNSGWIQWQRAGSIHCFPQTFQTEDIARLFAELAFSLVELRNELPSDLPDESAVRWLDDHRMGWESRLPVRMTNQTAEFPINPALRAERRIPSSLGRPLCRRELRCDDIGIWRAYLTVGDHGWLPARTFPGPEDVRLRLIPLKFDGLVYIATPEQEGFRLRRFNYTGEESRAFNLQDSFALKAFADGRIKGETVIDAGLSPPDEVPSFWRAGDQDNAAAAQRLVLLSGVTRTRTSCLWVLTSQDTIAQLGDGLKLEDPEEAPGGCLYRPSGNGIITLGSRSYRIAAKSQDDVRETRMLPIGDILGRWRFKRCLPVYQGKVTFYELGTGFMRLIPNCEIERTPNRLLFGELVEWIKAEAVQASFRLVCIPQTTCFELREIAPGCIELNADGLERVRRVTIKAGDFEESDNVVEGSVQLTLETQGQPPGLVELRLSELKTGSVLMLQSPWPTQHGMILKPNGHRLTDSHQLSIDALYGFRAIVPDGLSGNILLQMIGHHLISLPAAGEISLAALQPLIKEMPAQGGPDAQVNLSLVVGGNEGDRPALRRYQNQAMISDGDLRLGLDWDALATTPATVLETELPRHQNVKIHAIHINLPECDKTVDNPTSLNLLTHFSEPEKGPWLIQPGLNGQTQRAVVWPSSLTQNTSRDERINAYTDNFKQMLSFPEDSQWDRLGKLILAAGKKGDAGVLDQVQSLARIPAAAVFLTLVASHHANLDEILRLDTVVPIFWPVVSVTDFAKAIQSYREHLSAKLRCCFDQESDQEASHVLLRRIGKILTSMPELAGHFTWALESAGLFDQIINSPDLQEFLAPLLIPNCEVRLQNEAQMAAKRFDRLPHGVHNIEPPHHRPAGMEFSSNYLQLMIDAPLAAAEIAANRRGAPNVNEKLSLINLRLLDPKYFCAALPAALHFHLYGGCW